MASKYLGQALMDIGSRLPQTLQDRERLRMEDAERIAQLRRQSDEDIRKRSVFDQEQADRTAALGQLSAFESATSPQSQAEDEQFQRELKAEEAADVAKFGKPVYSDETPVSLDITSNGAMVQGSEYKIPSRYKLGQRLGLDQAAGILPQAKTKWESIAKEEEIQQRAATGGGLSGWKDRAKDWDAIEMMPDGPDKDRAYMNYMNKWAPSSAFGASELGIEAAGRRAGATGKASAGGKIEAETEAGGGVNPVVTERSNKLRDEFSNLPEIKSVKTLYQTGKKANDAMAQYKAGKSSEYEVDQSLGYFASKALDPNSVVMPGEFDRFAKGLGIAGGAQALASQLINGGLKLTDDQRNAMLSIVNRSVASGADAARSQYEYYSDLAKKNGTDPHSVTGGVEYIFKGASKDSGGLTDEKRKRLLELRAKKAAGTLGR